MLVHVRSSKEDVEIIVSLQFSAKNVYQHIICGVFTAYSAVAYVGPCLNEQCIYMSFYTAGLRVGLSANQFPVATASVYL